MEEAVEWVKRYPNPSNKLHEIEIRPVYELEDFPVYQPVDGK